MCLWEIVWVIFFFCTTTYACKQRRTVFQHNSFVIFLVFYLCFFSTLYSRLKHVLFMWFKCFKHLHKILCVTIFLKYEWKGFGTILKMSRYVKLFDRHSISYFRFDGSARNVRWFLPCAYPIRFWSCSIQPTSI